MKKITVNRTLLSIDSIIDIDSILDNIGVSLVILASSDIYLKSLFNLF
jgi:hypothetical protein